MRHVVDASVVLRWFAAQEPGAEAALAWLGRLAQDAELLAGPDLLRFEVLGGLARMQRGFAAGWAERSLERFDRLGMRLVPTDLALGARALELSRTLGLGGYDAVYLAHAEALGITWLTVDGRALRRLEGDPRVTPLLPAVSP